MRPPRFSNFLAFDTVKEEYAQTLSETENKQ